RENQRHRVPIGSKEEVISGDPRKRFEMSYTRDVHFEIGIFLCENASDPAIKHFYDRLRDYLLARLRHLNPEDDEIMFTQAERHTVSIQRNLIYAHQTCRINFTTYDMR
ncbi:hypothetical protein M422DRAFT_83448, partial [Sphaerobolus stellatus SS14]